MKLLIAVAILVTLALVGSSRRFWSWRRTRVGGALTTGGWLFVAIGFLLGPHGAKLVLPEQLIAVEPLIHFCLGWIGLMIGLQLERQVLTKLPWSVWRTAALDAGLSVAVVGAAVWAVASAWVWTWTGWSAVSVAMLLGLAAVGWPPDMRWLRRAPGDTERLAGLLRASASLGSVLAVIGYGVMFAVLDVGSSGQVVGVSGQVAAMGLGVSVAIGLTMGVMGKWLTGVAGRSAGEFLVVLLGMTAMMSGAAATMGHAPIFVGMWTGVVMCNLPGRSLDGLRRVVLDAEHPMAMVLMLVAGVLVDPRLGGLGLAVLGAVLVGRAVVKSVSGRLASYAASVSLPPRVLSLLVRQSPVAIALATGYAVSPYGAAGGPGLLSADRVLAVVVVIGVVLELWSMWRMPAEAIGGGEPGSDSGSGESKAMRESGVSR